MSAFPKTGPVQMPSLMHEREELGKEANDEPILYSEFQGQSECFIMFLMTRVIFVMCKHSIGMVERGL